METEEILAAIQKAAETIATPNCADKVSVVISIISALISLVAVIVAGYVAWKQYGITKKQNEITKKQNEIAFKQVELADQQNRISLFRERYELYQLLEKCMNMSDFLKTYQYCDQNELYKCVFLYFDKIVLEIQCVGKDRAIYAIRDITNRLYQSEFLFSIEISNHIRLLANYLRNFTLLEEVYQSKEEFQKIKNLYCEAASKLKSNNILGKMKSELQPILTR